MQVDFRDHEMFCILLKASCMLEFSRNVLTSSGFECVTEISGKAVSNDGGQEICTVLQRSRMRYRNGSPMQGNPASVAAGDSSHSDERSSSWLHVSQEEIDGVGGRLGVLE